MSTHQAALTPITVKCMYMFMSVYVCVFVMWVKIRKRGKLAGEKEKMSADCGRRLSISKHVATQVSVQA